MSAGPLFQAARKRAAIAQEHSMTNLENLKERIEAEARRGDMSLDAAVYAEAGRDPFKPILFAGSLTSRLAFFARDLGRIEVLLGEPLIGDAGQRVRRALYRALFHTAPPEKDARLTDAVEYVLLTNTVPYKPVGNKAYPPNVRERFRPYVAELLACHWQGDRIITMGTEAFMWFAPCAGRGAAEAFWKRPDRFEAELDCTLEAVCNGRPARRSVLLAPLPHPSPLNQTYLKLFPGLLEKRLEKLLDT
jgi:uracil-DNA glycosylase